MEQYCGIGAKKVTDGGARTRGHQVKSLALYRLSYTGFGPAGVDHATRTPPTVSNGCATTPPRTDKMRTTCQDNYMPSAKLVQPILHCVWGPGVFSRVWTTGKHAVNHVKQNRMYWELHTLIAGYLGRVTPHKGAAEPLPLLLSYPVCLGYCYLAC